jgi:CubicO group peptidase (beta-lactamase class C family)
MRSQRSFPIAVLLSFVLAATLAAQSLPMATPESVGMSSERLQRVGDRVQEYIDAGQVAGAVTLIAREGRVVHLEAHGHRDREANIPMTTDDLFVIMSMTKPIAATALMMLHEEGRFMLNDPISRWLPEFSDARVRVDDGEGGEMLIGARPITVRHVLTHSAGITASPAPLADPPEDQAGAATAPRAGDSPLRARMRALAANPLNFQPGERWEYASGGIASDVVAALVEEISGQNLDDFLRERLFHPLGMFDTHYNVPEEKWGRRARVYTPQRENGWRVEPRPVTEPTPTNLFRGVAGLSSTTSDYFRFAQMVMNGGEYEGVRILSPTTVNLMISNHLGEGIPVTLKGPGYGFGLGYSVLLDPGLASESLSPGSYGWGGAWGTYYVNDPVEQIVGIIMIQITSYGHLNIRGDLGTLAMQAITDSRASGAGRIQPRQRID